MNHRRFTSWYVYPACEARDKIMFCLLPGPAFTLRQQSLLDPFAHSAGVFISSGGGTSPSCTANDSVSAHTGAVEAPLIVEPCGGSPNEINHFPQKAAGPNAVPPNEHDIYHLRLIRPRR